jgi:hypothetical protein
MDNDFFIRSRSMPDKLGKSAVGALLGGAFPVSLSANLGQLAKRWRAAGPATRRVASH